MFFEDFIPTDGIEQDGKNETILFLVNCMENNTKMIFKIKLFEKYSPNF